MSKIEIIRLAVSNKATAGALALALLTTAGFEGLRLYTYIDPVGIPTYCFGRTKDARVGQTFTRKECEAFLAAEIADYAEAVERHVRVPMPETRWAAIISFTYNVGESALARSTLLRKLNAGDTRGACDELLKWDKARGIRLPGLTRRRQEERALCLEGL